MKGDTNKPAVQEPPDERFPSIARTMCEPFLDGQRRNLPRAAWPILSKKADLAMGQRLDAGGQLGEVSLQPVSSSGPAAVSPGSGSTGMGTASGSDEGWVHLTVALRERRIPHQR